MRMAEGAWSPMASFIALTRTVYRAKGQRPVSPDECNPFARRRKTTMHRVPMSSLKARFMAAGAIERNPKGRTGEVQ